MKKLLIPLLLLLVSIFSFNSCNNNKTKPSTEDPYLIMLSLDGFRWDYCEKANTPTFDSLKKAGSKAHSLKPCFPTKTFPNHYSMVTGLYPDNHGIVMNDFYATDLEREYSIRDRKAVGDGEFYGGKPIWNVAEENNIKSASLFWVGSSANVNNMRPSYWSSYFVGLSLDSRIDSLVNWLSLPAEKRPHLILWYYLEPDNIGHYHGPDSPELNQEIEKLDSFVGDFFTAMRKLPIFNKLNFIVTSDHGMSQLSPEREVFLDDFIDTNDIAFVNGGNPIMNIKAKEGNIEKVYNSLNSANTHFKVWKHGELPSELHYGNNIRTQDMTIVADSGWSIGWSWKNYLGGGTHGFDNKNKDMHAIFFAAGPAFKENYMHPTFNNIDIYPLVGEVLNIKMPKSDGNKENILGLLK